MTDIQTIKKELLEVAETNETLAIVGRVMDWLRNSESRLAVSCTKLVVEDSMEGEDGIEFSWLYTSKGLRFAAGVALDLSKLRGKNIDNGRGLISSGPVSFAQIYNLQNEILRRGGIFKNGSVVVYLDVSHPDFDEYLDTNLGDWIKKSCYLSDDPNAEDYVLNLPAEKLEKILYKVRTGELWLSKKRWYDEAANLSVKYQTPKRLYTQVCHEILLYSKSTCTLSHVNLGQCNVENLSQAFVDCMTFLCKLHSITGVGEGNYYLTANQDRQVGLGIIGMSNFLAIHKIKYAEFTDCLHDYLNLDQEDWQSNYQPHVIEVVKALYQAFQEAAKVARFYKMERAFTIAPTASSSFRYKDTDGYTTSPELSPPICHPQTKKTVRDSSTFGIEEYTYHPNCQTAKEVGWETYYKLAKTWQELMESTGLAHAISFNIWQECPVDMEWFKDWLDSPLITTYYRMVVDQDSIDKTSFNSLSDDSIYFDPEDDFFTPTDEETPEQCSINNKNFCNQCAE